MLNLDLAKCKQTLMNNNFMKTIHATRWLFTFIFFHLIAWTLAPILIRFNLPMDSIEGALWGKQLEWGYDKNPFMNGWLTALALKLDGHTGWAIYFFSQLSVAICFWAVWQLSKKILPPIYALLAVLLLEGMQYYSFHAIDFNDNTLELAIWALTTLFFYQALHTTKLRDWLLTGFFAGLGMMTKYYIVMLLLPMLLLLLIHPQGQKQFQKSGLYLGLLTFLIVITPHVFWLFSHDFVTLDYAVGRVTSPPSWYNHLFFPLQFAWQQFEVVLPSLFLLLILWIGKKPSRLEPRITINHFDKTFLFLVGTGPFLLTVLVSAITGIKLRAGWGQPLLSLWGIILIAWLQPYLTSAKFYRFIAVVFGFLILTVAAYCTALTRADGPSSANYPGKKIATLLTQSWHEHYHTPLKYIAGPRWLAGNIAFYSSDRPQVFIDWNHQLSPWINEQKLRENGAIFVWDLSENKNISQDEILKRFPTMSKPHYYEFAWLRNKNTPPVKIMVSFLSPQASHHKINFFYRRKTTQ
jgi:4-amino-4-deoxy-L-arabinose transferase-like glycosyltransferase